jgi:amino acid adenylation domain-containing protein
MSANQIADIYPLSPTQQGLLFHTIAAPASGMYVAQLTCTLHGDLNSAAFAQSWQRLLDRHPILRSAFLWHDLDQPVQVVGRRVTLPLTQHDWRPLTHAQQQTRRAALLADERRGFDLATAPLMRLTLVRLTDHDYLLVWSHHHLLLDGWSITLVLNEVFASYAALCQGRTPALAQPRPYRDYIAWLHQQDLAQAEAFWRATLHGLTAATPLPGDDPTTHAGTSAQQAAAARTLSAPTTAALQAFARRHGLTLNTLIQGAWALLLSRTSGAAEVVFGVTVAGRPAELPGVAQMVGLFINTLPLRVAIAPSAPLRDWLTQVQAAQQALRRYEHSPLVQVQSWSAIPRGQPLFESIVIFENYPVSTASSDQQGQTLLAVRDIQMVEQNNYPLALLALPGTTLTLRINYDRQRFDDPTIQRILGHLQTLLAGFVAQPQRPLAALPLLTAAERQQLVAEWNDTQSDQPLDTCLHELFAAQATRTPDAIALVCAEPTEQDLSGFVHRPSALVAQLTYAELDRRSNQLARHLQACGVGPEVLVGICLERSLDLLVALLGVLKAGGAYLPLDPTYPVARLAFMLEDAQASMLIMTSDERRTTNDEGVNTSSALRPSSFVKTVDLAADWPLIAQRPTAPPAHASTPANLAYLIYTSGSTGAPKGVAIPQRALVNLLHAMRRQPGMTGQDVLLAVTTIAFDIAGLELFLPLLCGARLELVPRAVAMDGRQLAARLVSRRPTIMQATPATWRLLIAAGWPGDDRLTILCGGEALPPDLADQLRARGAALWNLYGPTETTIWSAVAHIAADARVVLGRPIANTQIYLLDQRLHPVPVGVAGEVYIGGAGLARGYHGRPDLTAERFVPNPFVDERRTTNDEESDSSLVLGPSSRLYATGDLARYRPDGSIDFLGRIDQQVKIRGYRIELGEIEALLRSHAQVRSSVVLAREAPDGDKQLVAYVVPAEDERRTTNDESAPSSVVRRPPSFVSELRAFLAARLPNYMRPSDFTFLDALPLTPNGKIDRKALLAHDAPRVEQFYTMPRTPIEEVLAGVWSDVLGRAQVGVDDNFFDLGGHSLSALQVSAHLHEIFAVELPLQALFEAPTITALAERIELICRAAGIDATMVAQVFLKVGQLSEEEAKLMLSDIG